MKVLVLNGSPKRESSDTMHITRAFLKGMASAAPLEAEILHVADLHIQPCSGCFACWRNGGTCVHRDDMAGVLEKIQASDVLLVSYPLYCYGMPGPLKTLIDRILPLTAMTMRKVGERYQHDSRADTAHLRFVMICGCGFPNSAHNFEAAVQQFQLLFPRNHTILTLPESPMFNVPWAASVTIPRLHLVESAGAIYAREGALSPALTEEIASPMIPHEEYARIVNGQA